MKYNTNYVLNYRQLSLKKNIKNPQDPDFDRCFRYIMPSSFRDNKNPQENSFVWFVLS